MEIMMRAMTAADKPSVMAIFRALPEFNSMDVEIAEELCDDYIKKGESSGYYAYVAAVKGEVVGFLCYGETPLTKGTWDIYWMAVRQDMQGRGVGTRLQTFAVEKIREAGGRMILIETSGIPLYARTRAFHENQGYSEVCRIPDFYEPGDDKVVYWKRI